MVIIKFIFKLFTSFFLLYFIFNNIEINEFIKSIKSITAQILLISIILAIIIKVIESIRWKLLLDNNKIKFKFSKLFSINMVGGFFNIFLPSIIGGDALRIFYTKNKELSLMATTNTVLFERLIGLYSMFIMAIIAVVFGWNIVNNEIRITVITVSTIGIITFSFIYYYYSRFFRFLENISSKYNIKIIFKTVSFFRLFDFSKYNMKLIFVCFFFSALIYIIGIGVIIIIGNALGLKQISILYYFIIIPIVTIITLLPISIGGFGVREGLFALLLAPLGVSLGESTLLSLLAYFPFLIVGLIGGLFYLFGSYSQKEITNV